MLDVIEDEIDASRVQVNSSGDSMVFNPPRSNIKVTCRKCGKPRHLKKDCNSGNKANGLGTNGLVDGFTNSLKGQNMFNKSPQDSFLKAALGHAHFKRMQEMSKDGLILDFDMDFGKTESRVPRKPNQNYLKVWGCRAVVRLPDPKLKTLGERGIECIVVGYAEHSKAFSPRPSLRIPNGIEDIGGSVVPKEFTKEVVQQPELVLRKNKRNRTPKKFGPELRLYLIEGTRDEKQSMMRWIPSWATTLEDGTIEKFKARLGIQGFKQKSGINYFDIYAPMARISTIRLLIAMASIHNLIIHQMNVKTGFLNGELEEEVPKQWPQTFDEVVLFNGYLLNQANKCVYRKFNETGKGVIICLYVDDMLIFGTDQVHVDLTKEFLSTLTKVNSLVTKGVYYKKKKKLRQANLCYPWLDIAFTMGKLSRYTSNPGTQHWQVFLLGGGAISWASKKQSCITGSMTLAAAGKKAEWLRNLILEIPLWSKPIAPISIRYDSAATLAKAYS
ncbi:zinc finger, CCHC-type containing protein [Tanacetum coccineum]